MEMFEYSEKVMDHFRNPRNVGEIKNPDGVGKVGNPVCGDLMEIMIKVEKERLADVKFRTFGCGAAVATSSMVTEMAKGKTLDEALKITRADVAEELGGLPAIKMHCSNLAADALHAAIADYRKRSAEKVKEEAAPTFDYDVGVIGGGPGGLTTGMLCARRGLKTAVFEAESWGGILTRLCRDKLIENYPGLSGTVSCEALAEKWLEEAKKAGVDLKLERVTEIGKDKTVKTEKGKYTTRILVLATGSTPAGPGIPGEQKFEDKGVYYYVTNPETFSDKRVLIFGSGNTAITSALSLGEIAENVTLAHKEKALRGFAEDVERLKTLPKVKQLAETELLQVQGKDRVESVLLKDKVENKEYPMYVDAVVLAIGRTPNTALFKALGVKMDKRGYVETDHTQRTNVAGIYAVGDVASDLELVVTAAAHGATVAHYAAVELKGPK